MKSVMMIGFHYPPCAGSSGVLRTLKFSKYLARYGWTPLVLTAHPRAYPTVRDDQLGEISADVTVRRAFAIDAARHLALRGIYSSWTAIPDRWISWWLAAVLEGMWMIRRHRPAVIWSTYPIATAHLIGWTLHRWSGLPWVADFRDSMTEDNYPPDPLIRRSYRWIERRVVSHASRLVFTTKSALRMYVDRYPMLGAESCVVLSNGFDENDFLDLTVSPSDSGWAQDRKIRLVHAGLLYPEERNPRPFFQALAEFRRSRGDQARTLQIDLRASGSEDYYRAMIRELGVDDMVRLTPALPYRESLQDCARADGLLIFQAVSCDHQIPAKVYEYVRLQKPILAITSEKGDTADLLHETGGATIAELDSAEEIYAALARFVTMVRERSHSLPDMQVVRRYSRQAQTERLAGLLSQSVTTVRRSP